VARVAMVWIDGGCADPWRGGPGRRRRRPDSSARGALCGNRRSLLRHGREGRYRSLSRRNGFSGRIGLRTHHLYGSGCLLAERHPCGIRHALTGGRRPIPGTGRFAAGPGRCLTTSDPSSSLPRPGQRGRVLHLQACGNQRLDDDGHLRVAGGQVEHPFATHQQLHVVLGTDQRRHRRLSPGQRAQRDCGNRKLRVRSG
jgi:hypothetical protein